MSRPRVRRPVPVALGAWVCAGLVAAFGQLAPASGKPLGERCGGFLGLDCAKGLFCEFRPGACRILDRIGTCQQRGEICPMIFKPVCGCDAKTYPNDCMRKRSGVSLNYAGRC